MSKTHSAKAAMLGWAMALLVMAGCAGGSRTQISPIQPVQPVAGFVPVGGVAGAQYCDKSCAGLLRCGAFQSA